MLTEWFKDSEFQLIWGLNIYLTNQILGETKSIKHISGVCSFLKKKKNSSNNIFNNLFVKELYCQLIYLNH